MIAATPPSPAETQPPYGAEQPVYAATTRPCCSCRPEEPPCGGESTGRNRSAGDTRKRVGLGGPPRRRERRRLDLAGTSPEPRPTWARRSARGSRCVRPGIATGAARKSWPDRPRGSPPRPTGLRHPAARMPRGHTTTDAGRSDTVLWLRHQEPLSSGQGPAYTRPVRTRTPLWLSYGYVPPASLTLVRSIPPEAKAPPSAQSHS